MGSGYHTQTEQFQGAVDNEQDKWQMVMYRMEKSKAGVGWGLQFKIGDERRKADRFCRDKHPRQPERHVQRAWGARVGGPSLGIWIELGGWWWGGHPGAFEEKVT